MAPTVSVVIAAYDFERLLPRAIDSVLAPDHPAVAIEIIIVRRRVDRRHAPS
jgi:glycosyltransferase involved in cell wall biosynthesis